MITWHTYSSILPLPLLNPLLNHLLNPPSQPMVQTPSPSCPYYVGGTRLIDVPDTQEVTEIERGIIAVNLEIKKRIEAAAAWQQSLKKEKESELIALIRKYDERFAHLNIRISALTAAFTNYGGGLRAEAKMFLDPLAAEAEALFKLRNNARLELIAVMAGDLETMEDF